MARPGLIAALLLPLPFAALPLVAVLLGGPTFSSNDDNAVYAPVTSPAIIQDEPAGLAKWPGLHGDFADVYTHGCDDFASGT